MTTEGNVERAIRELGIDVPVMRAEVAPDGTITLYLYGGQQLTWSPPKPKSAPRRAEPALAIPQPPTTPPATATPAPRRKSTKKEVPQDEPVQPAHT